MNAQDQDQDQLRDRDRDRLMMVDGDLLRIRDRDQIRLNDELLLADGTIVQPNGVYETLDGKRLRLKDGECLDMDGVFYRNEYQYRYKIQRENIGLSENQIQNRNQNRWQLMFLDGNVYQIQNQIQERVQDQYKLDNGEYVSADGRYMNQDRQQLRLRDGECLDMDGNAYQNTYMHRVRTIKMDKNINKANIKKPEVKTKSINKKGKIGYGLG